ncbi:MAG: DUF4055 domain-containing protein, partial [Zetaproteobacteria bacterium]|nr:DUF4055 domain-containing protein [Zetaproteobacteria bacterium]
MAYVERASYLNATAHTKEGLLGMVFREDPVVEFPPGLEYLGENSDNAGTPFIQLVKNVISDTVETGRYGILADYPQMEGGETSDVTGGVTAGIMRYPAESITNWRETTKGGVTSLAFVVLEEAHQKYAGDGFSFESVAFHRVLRIDDSGAYVQELYNEDDLLISQVMPRRFDGSAWREIPFVFIGSQNNDPPVDKPPLYDLSVLNIAHLRNSADQEESSFLVGQPTPVITGLSQGWVDEVMAGGILLGSRSPWLLPEGGAASLLQAAPNQLPLVGMEQKERQMVQIGARLIQDAKTQETAEAARLRYLGQNSKLAVLVGNVERAFMTCFGWIQEFMGGAGEEVTFKINRNFYQATLDPQMIVAQLQLLDRSVISVVDVRENLRETGILDPGRTDEDVDADRESESPIGGQT